MCFMQKIKKKNPFKNRLTLQIETTIISSIQKIWDKRQEPKRSTQTNRQTGGQNYGYYD